MTNPLPQPNLAETLTQRFVNTPLVISRLQHPGVGSRALQWSQALVRPFLQPTRSLTLPEQALTLIARIRRQALPEMSIWPRSRVQTRQLDRSFSEPPVSLDQSRSEPLGFNALPLLQASRSVFPVSQTHVPRIARRAVFPAHVPSVQRQRTEASSQAHQFPAEFAYPAWVAPPEDQAWSTFDQPQASAAESFATQSALLSRISSQSRILSPTLARLFRSVSSQGAASHPVSGLSQRQSIYANLLLQPASRFAMNAPFADPSGAAYSTLQPQPAKALIQSMRGFPGEKAGFTASSLPLVLARRFVAQPTLLSRPLSSPISRAASASAEFSTAAAQIVQPIPISATPVDLTHLQPRSESAPVPSVPAFSLGAVQRVTPATDASFEPTRDVVASARVRPIRRSMSPIEPLQTQDSGPIGSRLAQVAQTNIQPNLPLLNPKLASMALVGPVLSRMSRIVAQPARFALAPHAQPFSSAMAVFRSFTQAPVAAFSTSVNRWNAASLPLVVPSRSQAIPAPSFGNQTIARTPASAVPNSLSELRPTPSRSDLAQPFIHEHDRLFQRILVPSVADSGAYSQPIERLSMLETPTYSSQADPHVAAPQVLTPHLPLLQRTQSFAQRTGFHAMRSPSGVLARSTSVQERTASQVHPVSRSTLLINLPPAQTRASRSPDVMDNLSTPNLWATPALPLIQAMRSALAAPSRASSQPIARAHSFREADESLAVRASKSSSLQPDRSEFRNSVSSPATLGIIAPLRASSILNRASFAQRTPASFSPSTSPGAATPFLPLIARTPARKDFLPNSSVAEHASLPLPLVQLTRSFVPSQAPEQHTRANVAPSSLRHAHPEQSISNIAPFSASQSSEIVQPSVTPVLARSLVQGSQSFIQRLATATELFEHTRIHALGRSADSHPDNLSPTQPASPSQQVASITLSRVFPSLPLIQTHPKSVQRFHAQALFSDSSSDSFVQRFYPHSQATSAPINSHVLRRSSDSYPDNSSPAQPASPSQQVASITLSRAFPSLPLIQTQRSFVAAQPAVPFMQRSAQAQAGLQNLLFAPQVLQRSSQAQAGSQNQFFDPQAVLPTLVSVSQIPFQRAFDDRSASLRLSQAQTPLARSSIQARGQTGDLAALTHAQFPSLPVIQPFRSLILLNHAASIQRIPVVNTHAQAVLAHPFVPVNSGKPTLLNRLPNIPGSSKGAAAFPSQASITDSPVIDSRLVGSVADLFLNLPSAAIAEPTSLRNIQRIPIESSPTSLVRSSLPLTRSLATPLLQLFRAPDSAQPSRHAQQAWLHVFPLPEPTSEAAVAAPVEPYVQRVYAESAQSAVPSSRIQPLTQVQLARLLRGSAEPFSLLQSRQASLIARKRDRPSSSVSPSQLQAVGYASSIQALPAATPVSFPVPSQALVQPIVEGSMTPFAVRSIQRLSPFLGSQPLIQPHRFELGSPVQSIARSSFSAERSVQGSAVEHRSHPPLIERSADLALPVPVSQSTDPTFAAYSAPESNLQQPLIQPSRSSAHAPVESAAAMELLTPLSTLVSRMLESGAASPNQEQQIQVSQDSESSAVSKKISPEQIQWLARQVYTRLRRQMLIELERLGRR